MKVGPFFSGANQSNMRAIGEGSKGHHNRHQYLAGKARPAAWTSCGNGLMKPDEGRCRVCRHLFKILVPVTPVPFMERYSRVSGTSSDTRSIPFSQAGRPRAERPQRLDPRVGHCRFTRRATPGARAAS